MEHTLHTISDDSRFRVPMFIIYRSDMEHTLHTFSDVSRCRTLMFTINTVTILSILYSRLVMGRVVER